MRPHPVSLSVLSPEVLALELVCSVAPGSDEKAGLSGLINVDWEPAVPSRVEVLWLSYPAEVKTPPLSQSLEPARMGVAAVWHHAPPAGVLQGQVLWQHVYCAVQS